MVNLAYGSDSEDEEVQSKPAEQVKSAAPSSKRKERGPVKLVMDLPSVKASQAVSSAQQEDEGPAKKRPKFDTLKGKSGLAGMLPPPKKSTMSLPPPSASTSTQASSDSPATASPGLLLPPTVQRRAAAAAKQPPIPKQDSLDLFGLSSISSAPIASTSKVASTTFQSAPSVKEATKVNYYATLPPATPNDPYPGFHCLPSGQWAPNQPGDWAEWAEQHGWSTTAQVAEEEADAPKGFEAHKMTEMQEASGENKSDGPAIPEKMVYTEETNEELEAKKRKFKQMAGRARGKNQLSSLLSDAMERREELEERIAMAKANKKAGGAKYGFN